MALESCYMLVNSSMSNFLSATCYPDDTSAETAAQSLILSGEQADIVIMTTFSHVYRTATTEDVTPPAP